MAYAIIKNMASLAVSRVKLDVKLREAAGLFNEHLGFDQCAVYLRDTEHGGFGLRAGSGEKEGLIRAYGEDEGVTRLARKAGRALEVYRRNPGEVVWKGRVDQGLKGFRTVFVYPLMDNTRCCGFLYLKSRRKKTLSPDRVEVLRIAALQLVSLIKFHEMVEDYKEASGELEEMRGRLLNAEKLMALGDMAASLAHEIKNPLVSVGGFASRIRRHLGDDSPVVPYVDQMLAEIKRLEKIVSGSIRFLKEDLEVREPGDLNEILDDAVGLFEDECRCQGIEVVRDFHKGAINVMADREQLKIAFDNLIANAIQSMEKGGTLKLSTVKTEGWAVAEVSDSGGGIDPRHLGFIFNPFFTTKEEGTGLGLPITNSIVMRHKGMIDVANRVGEGVTFRVKLPCVEKGKKST